MRGFVGSHLDLGSGSFLLIIAEGVQRFDILTYGSDIGHMPLVTEELTGKAYLGIVEVGGDHYNAELLQAIHFR